MWLRNYFKLIAKKDFKVQVLMSCLISNGYKEKFGVINDITTETFLIRDADGICRYQTKIEFSAFLPKENLLSFCKELVELDGVDGEVETVVSTSSEIIKFPIANYLVAISNSIDNYEHTDPEKQLNSLIYDAVVKESLKLKFSNYLKFVNGSDHSVYLDYLEKSYGVSVKQGEIIYNEVSIKYLSPRIAKLCYPKK